MWPCTHDETPALLMGLAHWLARCRHPVVIERPSKKTGRPILSQTAGKAEVKYQVSEISM